jgi:hypothetical protein
MSFKDEINEAAKDVDDELKMVELYNKLISDKHLKSIDVVYSDVTVKELAVAMTAARGCIDILKFELGE